MTDTDERIERITRIIDENMTGHQRDGTRLCRLSDARKAASEIVALPPIDLAEELIGYEPIKTAPRDGTPIELPPIALTARWKSGIWALDDPGLEPTHWRLPTTEPAKAEEDNG